MNRDSALLGYIFLSSFFYKYEKTANFQQKEEEEEYKSEQHCVCTVDLFERDRK